MWTKYKNRITRNIKVLLVIIIAFSAVGSYAQINWYSISMHLKSSSILVANGDYLSIGEGREDEINVLNNDFGLKSGIKELTIVQAPEHAEVAVLDNNKIYFKAELGYAGEDELVYKVCSNDGQCDEAKVLINIEDIDFIPVANTDSIKVIHGEEIFISILSNDQNLFDDPATVYILEDFNNGAGHLDAEENILASFDEYFRGKDSLLYEVCDANGDCSQAWLHVEIQPLIVDDIFIPQGISPNGDGFNDTFFIPDLQGLTMRIKVFDVFGNMVYQNNQYHNGWDAMGNEGKYNGKFCKAGTYFFILQVPSIQKDFSGFIYINM